MLSDESPLSDLVRVWHAAHRAGGAVGDACPRIWWMRFGRSGDSTVATLAPVDPRTWSSSPTCWPRRGNPFRWSRERPPGPVQPWGWTMEPIGGAGGVGEERQALIDLFRIACPRASPRADSAGDQPAVRRVAGGPGSEGPVRRS